MSAGHDMIERRRVMTSIAAVSAWFVTSGHTPYRQWQVYRQKHLLIGTNKSEPLTYDLGKKMAALLMRELPASRARVARAPHAWRLASLMTTDQIPLVLLSAADATALAEGRDGFEAFGEVELRALFRIGAYWLICRPDFPDDHAVLLTRTLSDHGASLAKIQGPADDQSPVPIHASILDR